MPNRLPKDFFIPDDEYDAATADTGAGGAPARALNPGNGAARSVTPSPFVKNIDEILKKSRVPADKIQALHAAMQKEFDTLSDEVAARVKLG